MESLYKKLLAYEKNGRYPFHMPGHKRNKRFDFYLNPYGCDITEIDGFDNLHHSEDIIEDLRLKLAKAFKARESFISVNGSTAGILAVISALDKKHKRILVSRNCHKAVYHSIILNNLEVDYIYPQIIEKLGINGGIKPYDVEIFLKKKAYDGVLITSPTYEGVASDIENIAKICHKYKTPLIVDQAHGAHFVFSNKFPQSSMELGADIVIESLHKTLPAMTQTGVVNYNSNLISLDRLKKYMEIYQSSSPSYILMASIDYCIDYLNKHENIFKSYNSNILWLRENLSEEKNISIFTPKIGYSSVFAYDNTKLVIYDKNLCYSGTYLHKLYREQGIEMELDSLTYILAYSTVGDTREGIELLLKATKNINKGYSKANKLELPNILPLINKSKMKISEAMEAKGESIPIEDSVNRISKEFAFYYPPGIPLITPGEVITRQFVTNMRTYMKYGFELKSLDDKNNKIIKVVK